VVGTLGRRLVGVCWRSALRLAGRIVSVGRRYRGFMSPELAVGLSNTSSTIVTADMSPSHLAPVVVLATPEMIWLIERTCTDAVEPLLAAENRTTVGTHVDISHESAAREGEEVIIEATLVYVDGPRLRFEVLARVGDRVVGRGTHRRHVVDRSRFGA
jgi:fluoroacetyl-CoA thioesterase